MDEHTIYHVKLVRLFDPEPKLIWEGECKFHIQRRRNLDIGVIAPKDGLPELPDWAEYCQEDIESVTSETVRFVNEDYLMIVKV